MDTISQALAEFNHLEELANRTTQEGADHQALVEQVARKYRLNPATFARYVVQNTFTTPN